MSKMTTRQDFINQMVYEELIPDYVGNEWAATSRPTRGDLISIFKGIENKIQKAGSVNSMTYANYVDYHINQKYVAYMSSYNIIFQAMREPFFDHSWDFFIASSKKKQKELFASFSKNFMKESEERIKENARFDELAMFAKKPISMLYLISLVNFESECERAWRFYTSKNYSSLYEILNEGWENKIFQKSYIKMLNLDKDTFKNYKEKSLDEDYKNMFGPKKINQVIYFQLANSLPFIMLDKYEWQKIRLTQYDQFASEFCKYEGIKKMKLNALKKYCFKSLKKDIKNAI